MGSMVQLPPWLVHVLFHALKRMEDVSVVWSLKADLHRLNSNAAILLVLATNTAILLVLSTNTVIQLVLATQTMISLAHLHSTLPVKDDPDFFVHHWLPQPTLLLHPKVNTVILLVPHAHTVVLLVLHAHTVVLLVLHTHIVVLLVYNWFHNPHPERQGRRHI